MATRPSSIRKHAILKRHYRRAVAAASDFHSHSSTRRWELLRNEVLADPSAVGAKLLEILDSREARCEEVLAALEEGRQSHLS